MKKFSLLITFIAFMGFASFANTADIKKAKPSIEKLTLKFPTKIVTVDEITYNNLTFGIPDYRCRVTLTTCSAAGVWTTVAAVGHGMTMEEACATASSAAHSLQ